MMHKFLRTLAGLSLLAVAGCSDPTLEEELLGAWYGDGPDGEQCFVFCGDGRAFTGDRPCDDSMSGDFAESAQVTFGEDSFFLMFGPRGVQLTDVSVDGDAMRYMFDTMSYSMSRTQVPDYCSTRP